MLLFSLSLSLYFFGVNLVTIRALFKFSELVIKRDAIHSMCKLIAHARRRRPPRSSYRTVSARKKSDFVCVCGKKKERGFIVKLFVLKIYIFGKPKPVLAFFLVCFTFYMFVQEERKYSE